MIRTAAALLAAIKAKETEAIDRSGIKHAPTIGEQYEKLTASLLDYMIPEELELEVVNGFVEGIDGTLSGQIDCMLVRGAGRAIPYSDGSIWHVRNVLAVFEVKKRLFSTELSDAHAQLNTVLNQFWDYAEQLSKEDQIDVTAALHVYGQIVGEPAPSREALEHLPFEKDMIYRTLIAEQMTPLRIIFGYYGYQDEYQLRTGFVKFLRHHLNTLGYAGSSFPDLIVCGDNSLIKLNGHPYYELVRPLGWPWYASSSENPLLLLLNLLLTKISYLYRAPDWFGRDLSLERFTILLFGKAAQENGVNGWFYEPVNLSKRDLESGPPIPEEDWRPMSVTSFQFTILTMMGDEDGLSREVIETIAADDPSVDGEAQIKELVDHRLVGWQGDKLVFLTQRCATAFTGRGEVVAGDVEDWRLVEWIRQEGERRQEAKRATAN